MRRSLPVVLAGAVAVAVALAVAELLAGLVSGAPSLVNSVGALVIDLQPPGAKDFVVVLFGEADKLALNVATAVTAMAIGALLAVLSTQRFATAVVGFGAFGALGFVAALRDPLVTPFLAAATVLAAVASGLWALRRMLPTAVAVTRRASPAAPSEGPSRRRVLAGFTAALAVAAGVGTAGRLLADRRPPVRPARPIPAAADPLDQPGPGTSLPVEGLTPIIVPNDEFYRIDTRLDLPRIDAETWRLRVHGLVEREFELSYSELLAMPLIERYVTIACVSNEVGGHLVGNAKWTGVRLAEVLERAGVRPEATQIVGRSFDGWTCGFPTAFGAERDREALIAVAMNGEPLPVAHGFPARLIVPGLFGYVSATKWLTEIALTRWEAFDAYWVPLGWAKEAPVLTQSRIDTPRSGALLAAGPAAIAGVAWAPTRGIARVEVALDDGDWTEALLSQPLADTAWVQWSFDWNAAPGPHRIAVRATDGTGEMQAAEPTRPAPDGARGYHTIQVTVA